MSRALFLAMITVAGGCLLYGENDDTTSPDRNLDAGTDTDPQGGEAAATSCPTTCGGPCASVVAPGWLGDTTCAPPACVPETKGCSTPPTAYNDVDNASEWSVFDVSTVDVRAKGFRGGVYDGRYIYLVPSSDTGGAPDGLVMRFDPQAPFGAKTSWSKFDVATVAPEARGFGNGAFDGRYLYLVPYADQRAILARFDTTAAFDDPLSWTTFDVSMVKPEAKGFLGAVFDGRYLYFVPHNNGTPNPGVVARYDTTAAALDAKSAWLTFDTAPVAAGRVATGFAGGTFDGRYVYFAPYYNATATYHGNVTRYDTQGEFDSLSAWSSFDMTTAHAGATSYEGAVFDGRFVYFVPFYHGTPNGLVARYDSQAPFTAAPSWSFFDTSTLPDAGANASAKGFHGGHFDGRYVYFVPHNNGDWSGTIARFDTQGAFGSASAWVTYDISTGSGMANAKSFSGAVSDGRYLYLVPYTTDAPHGNIARFDDKSPAWLAKGWKSSFF